MRDNMALYEDLETFIPNHKLGFKILKEEQLRNAFPSYEILLEKIKYHRQKLNEHKKIRGLDSQYNLMYDNVYSIMGERGSGKTSALFTLKKIIEKDFPDDWVLPVIMPEMIPENADIIGWILATLGDVVTKLEKKLEKNDKIRHDSAYFRDCKFKANNELRQIYEEVKELHFSKNPKSYQQESLSVASDNFEIQTFNGFEFAKKFSRLWDVLVDAISKSEGDQTEKNPLIYIMFDDVDLTPHRIMDILSTIIKYLAHPNLIVLITAEEGLFYEVVFNQLCVKLDKDKLDEKIMRRTAQLYVDKVMPPSSRFYLELFDDCDKKKSFIQLIETQSKETENKTLEVFLREQVNDYIKLRVSPKEFKEYDNFLYYNKNKDQFLQTYFLFWGNTSRQLVNESLIVSNFISSLKNSYEKVRGRKIDDKQYEEENYKQYVEEVYKHVHGFIKSSIISNINLRSMTEDVEGFVNIICNRNKTRWPIFINYEALEKFYFERVGENKSEENVKKMTENVVAIFVLLFFAENLLFISDQVRDDWSICKERKYIHGAKHLVAILDSLLPNTISLTRDSQNNNAVADLLFDYSNILCNPAWLCKFNIYNYLDVKEYMYPLYSRKETSKITPDDLYRWHTENPRWFNTMTRMVFLMSTGIYILNKRNAKDFLWRKDIKIYDPYILRMSELEEKELKERLLDSYQYVDDGRTHVSYYTYLSLLHKTNMIEMLQDELDISSDTYNLEDIKQKMIDFLEDSHYVREMKLKDNLETSERILRKVSFVYVVDKEVWGHGTWTKDVIKKEIQRVQNYLIQSYGSADMCCMNNPEAVRKHLYELKEQDVSWEIKKLVDYILKEMENSNTLQVIVFNRLIELIDEHLEQDDDFPWNNHTKIKNIRKYLLDNMNLLFKLEETVLPAIEMIMQHETLLYLQELYLETLLDEMKELLRGQGMIKNSFYKRYLTAMLDVLEMWQYGKDGRFREDSMTSKVYLGRYMREIIQETVDIYLKKCEILQTKESGEILDE